MGPDKPLPYNSAFFNNADSYVDSLLHFIGTNELLQTLCGGVHLLDFFTSDPDLYSRILPQEWRDFFAQCGSMMDLLDLFMREDLEQFSAEGDQWRGGSLPPASLVEYLQQVRKHLLDREVKASQCSQNRTQKKLARHVAVGMSLKKVHEVGLYASYIHSLATSIQHTCGQSISHLIDLGSGQNYLGRALASDPYNRDIVAIESKSHNAERAKDFDVKARIVEKQRVMRDKKAHRAGAVEPKKLRAAPPRSEEAKKKWPEIERKEAITYVEHRIRDGELGDVISHIPSVQDRDGEGEDGVMIISLHSCGNLVHHGLRSLVLNPCVKAVAMVGCCYNLLTERLGPATYKHPELRPTTHLHPRLRGTEGDACDPHGFPMSNRLLKADVRLNITARMMAVQAPQNWGEKDSEAFFTRHFYRALLQRVFLDKGIVGPPSPECVGGSSPSGHSSGGTPITIGSLRKGCYENFPAYVRGAIAKLCDSDPPSGLSATIQDRMGHITDAELASYESRYLSRKKQLSVIWSLMAFSAGVIEAAILVDRWCWLREQKEMAGGEAWVESVFEYGVSPRNLVVVGVKK
ncbi:hypothetical protein LTR37_012158 [Vermiconidia calcicola]|uniref:Uncharacterized protein n=1 Tax=Vermiconidia calcicola TaxID=1690605 RepID=A0ACC3N0H9_9PEZI|nr:hypothetical protein LTR37_012158 [Vermiconidia calcicola]